MLAQGGKKPNSDFLIKNVKDVLVCAANEEFCMGGYDLYYLYCGLGRTYVEVSKARVADGAGVEVCGLLGDREEVVYFIY